MSLLMDYLLVHYFSEKGQGMAEYALVLAFVVAVIVLLSNTDLVQAIDNMFEKINVGSFS